MSFQWTRKNLKLSLSVILATLAFVIFINVSFPTQNVRAANQVENYSKQADSNVSRVVALSSLSADIISRLDASKLVGRPGSRLLDRDGKFSQIPTVSQGQTQPSLEKIVALKPDLVVGVTGFHEQTAQKLQQMGIPTSLFRVNSRLDLEELTKSLAKAIAANPESLLQKYQTIFAKKPPESASTLVLVSTQPILSPNKESWTGSLLANFKIGNLADELQANSSMRGYVSLSPEKILQANPENLIVIDTGDRQLIEQLKSQAFWQQLPAVKNNRVFVFDYYGLINPGSINAIEQATTKLQQVFDLN